MLINYLILIFGSTTLCHTNAAPTKNVPALAVPQQAQLEDIQFSIEPHVISLERFENLLRRAGEIFRPTTVQFVKTTTKQGLQSVEKPQQLGGVGIGVPYEQMQPPTEQPYSFYMPLFETEQVELDEKSSKMSEIMPPPLPSKQQDTTNYYALKPKKLPKKFDGNSKQVNLKWLNDALKKDALPIEMSKAAYLMQDERNRINFDDSFFSVDMHVKTPDNEPHKESLRHVGKSEQEDDFLNQGEETGEEDLLAAAAVQIPIFSLVDYKTVKRV